MAQEQSRSNDKNSRRGPSFALIAASVFLVISLIASGVIVFMALTDTPTIDTQVAEATPIPPTAIPVEEQADQPTPDVSQTPTSEIQPTDVPEILSVEVAALNPPGDTATGEQLADAIRQAVESANLPLPVEALSVELPTDVEPADVSRDAPDNTLLVIWENTGDGLIAVYVYAKSGLPSIAQLDEMPALWVMTTPGMFPIYAESSGDLFVPAGMVAGTLEMLVGNHGKALERFRALQTLPPDMPTDVQVNNLAVVNFAIGVAQTGQGDLRGALQSYSQALRLESDFAAAQINRGSVYLSLGDPVTALTAYNAVLDGGSGQIEALYNRAIANMMLGDWDTSLDDIGQVIELEPRTAWSVNLRGIIHYRQGNHRAALDDFALASSYEPEAPTPLFNRAQVHYVLGEYEEALAIYEMLLDVEPNSPMFHLNQGLAYQAVGDLARAEYAFNRAIGLDREYLDAYLLRAWLHLENGDYDKSLADADQALALNPGEGRAYWVIGDVMLALEDFTAAKDAYTEALDRGEHSPEVYAGRGWAWHRVGYVSGAAEDYEQAIALGLDAPELFYRQGFALFDLGRYDEALPAFERALEGGLDTAEVHAALALALDTNLRRDEAEQEYQIALDMDARYGDVDFLNELILWSDAAVTRAVTIMRRMGLVEL